MVSVAEQKAAAAGAAVDDFLETINFSSKKVYLGIGSGSTIVYAIERLAERLKDNPAKFPISNIVCVPTSFQAKKLIIDHGLTLATLDQYPELDLAIDGADDVDENLNLIKGGGGCQTIEKMVAYASKVFYVVCDESKNSVKLFDNWANGLPIEVLPTSYPLVEKTLTNQLKAKKITLRMALKKAGPVVTDSGNFILDAEFDIEGLDLSELEVSIRGIPGVVCTGFFLGMAHKVFFGNSDGSVTVKSKHKNGKIEETVVPTN